MKEDFEPYFGPGRHLLTLRQVRLELAPDEAGERRSDLYRAFYSLVQRLKRLSILCEVWLDGSFVTRKREPNDVDLSVMVHEDVYAALSDEAKQLLDDISYSEGYYLDCLDAFVCIHGTKGSDDYDLDDPLDYSRLWSKDHSERFLKGFVVVEVKP